MSINLQQLLAVIGGASAMATAIFWGAFYLGKIWSRLDDHERRLEDHEKELAELRA